MAQKCAFFVCQSICYQNWWCHENIIWCTHNLKHYLKHKCLTKETPWITIAKHENSLRSFSLIIVYMEFDAFVQDVNSFRIKIFFTNRSSTSCPQATLGIDVQYLDISSAIGVSRGGIASVRPPPPQWDPILPFSHTFSPKSACVGSWCPPNGKSWIRHWMQNIFICTCTHNSTYQNCLKIHNTGRNLHYLIKYSS